MQQLVLLFLFQVYRRVVWGESLVSGASCRLGAAGVLLQSAVHLCGPTCDSNLIPTVCLSRASAPQGLLVVIVCNIFHIPWGNREGLDGLWICFSQRPCDVQSKNHWWSHVSINMWMFLMPPAGLKRGHGAELLSWEDLNSHHGGRVSVQQRSGSVPVQRLDQMAEGWLLCNVKNSHRELKKCQYQL